MGKEGKEEVCVERGVILIVEDTKKDKEFYVFCVCEGEDTLNKGQANGKVLITRAERRPCGIM